MSHSLLQRRILSRGLLFAGVLACAIGFVQARMWHVLPVYHCAELIGIGGVLFGAAWALARVARLSLATALLIVWTAPLVYFAGMSCVLAVTLLALTAMAIGAAFTTGLHIGDSSKPMRAGDAALTTVLGLALIAGVSGWLLPLPIFFQPLWFALLLAIVVWRWRVVATQLQTLRRRWRSITLRAPRLSATAMLTLGLASLATWLPTMQFDDLAYHLGLPWQLQLHARYALNPATQIWALAPWSSDVLHGLVQLLGGREGRGALNALWLVLSAGLVWQLSATLGAARRLRWLAVVLYASLPMTSALLGGMQTENAGTAALLALALLVRRAQRTDRTRAVYSIAVACAFVVALKASGILLVIPFLAWLAWQWRFAMPWRALPLSLLLAVLVGGSSYFYAAVISGNPVLPLFNGIFHSPYFDSVNFTDPRWHAGWNAALPWNLSFHTARYAEGWDGAAGFALIGMSGALVLAVCRARTRALAIVALIVFALSLTPLQYLRYAHPAMALLIPVMVAGARVALPTSRVLLLGLALAALNFVYQGNAHWTLRSGAIFDVLRAHGNDQRVLAVWAPERLLTVTAREKLPSGARILATDIEHPFIAELAGAGRTISWYDRALAQQGRAAQSDPAGERWFALLQRNQISAVMLSEDSESNSLRAGLQRAGALRIAAEGDAELWALPSAAVKPNVDATRAN